MRQLIFGTFLFLALPFFGGCGPNLSSKDFGTIVDGIPKIAGADKFYEMPELGPPPSEEELRRLRHK
jgi:hypothetical protein